MKIEYLLNPKKRNSSAHLFVDGDTVCRMLSTGGIKRERNQVFQSDMGKPICTMCATTLRKKVAGLLDKMPQKAAPDEPRDFQVTEAWIRRYRTEAGAWRAVQLAAIDVAWPPTHGWIDAVCGTRITRLQRATFEKYGAAKDPDATPRIYLECPYEDRAHAKANGAKWDADARAWYVSGIEDLTPFMRWMPGHQEKVAA